jgi:hypothetical protein
VRTVSTYARRKGVLRPQRAPSVLDGLSPRAAAEGPTAKGKGKGKGKKGSKTGTGKGKGKGKKSKGKKGKKGKKGSKGKSAPGSRPGSREMAPVNGALAGVGAEELQRMAVTPAVERYLSELRGESTVGGWSIGLLRDSRPSRSRLCLCIVHPGSGIELAFRPDRVDGTAFAFRPRSGGAGDAGAGRAAAAAAAEFGFAEAHRHSYVQVKIIPHHETFSTTIQPPYSSTKGWII